MKKIIRIHEIEKLTGLTKSTIYRLMAKQQFPKSVQLGFRSVGWVESAVKQWVEDRIAMSKAEKI